MALNAPTPRDRRGFALIIAVSLLALLVMVLIAMATLTRVETSVGVNSRLSGSAQQNALYALNVALGELQRHAGPDTRITATADIRTEPSESRYLTGVWNSQGGLRTWLVSGNETVPDSGDLEIDVDLSGRMTPSVRREQSDGASGFEPLEAPETVDARKSYVRKSFRLAPTSGQAQPGALLVGPYTAGHGSAGEESRYIVAPLVELNGPIAGEASERTVGRYAWWTGDEGVKAKLNLRDVYADAGASVVNDQLRRTIALRFGAEQVVTGFPVNSVVLDQVVHRNQLCFLTGVDFSNVRDHFHDFTTESRGVLADVANGGLRKDLSRILNDAPAGFGDGNLLGVTAGAIDGDPVWGALRSFGQRRWASGVGVVPFASVGNVQGIHPLTTAISIWTGVTLGEAGARLHLTCRATVAIANPYDVPLGAATYTIRIDDATGMGVSVRRAVGAGSPQTINGVPSFISLVSLTASGSLEFVTPRVSFSPGEVKLFSTSAGGLQATGGPIPLVEGNPINEAGAYGYYSVRHYDPIPPATVVLAPGEAAAIRLNGGRFDFTLGIQDGATLQSVERVQVSSDTGYRIIPRDTIEGGEFSPYPHHAIGTGFTVYMRGAEGIAATANNVRWLANHSPRARVLSRVSGDPWAENPVWDGIRILRQSGARTPVMERDLSLPLWGRSFEAGVGSPFVGLFHVLREEATSLGQFQHASFSGDSAIGVRLAAYPIANSYASPYVAVDRKDLSYGLNEVLFDEFFVSGFVDSNLPELPLRNRRLVHRLGGFIPPLSHENVAAFLFVDGPFNVNSTSQAAWEALFSSLNGIEDPHSTGTRLSRPFFRSPNPVDDESNSLGGTFNLSPSQVSTLAENIVQQVRERGPFTSLGSFVNRRLAADDTPAERANVLNVKGALQTAIDETAGLQPAGMSVLLSSVPTSPSIPYPQAAVGAAGANLSDWLSQADMLTALAPVLAVRSDTFVIRAYGETVNPLLAANDRDYIQSRAWCEATVQRVPDYVDYRINADGTLASGDFPWESGTDLNSTNERFGRRFVITSFRWLSPDDI